MTKAMRYVLIALFATTGLFAGRSHADVIIKGTRVVYPASEKEVTMQLTNTGNKPMLVQVWVDDYRSEEASPDQAKVPFTVMPALFRVEPHKGQAVRILYNKAPLPIDKESLFRVNALEVPPRVEAESGESLLKFAIRTRIKLIFRPKGLSADGAFNAPKQLQWSLRISEDGKTPVLRVQNPTPYYVNFANVGAKVGEKEFKGLGGMVAPGDTSEFPIKELIGYASKGVKVQFEGTDVKVQFEAISDIGARMHYIQPLSS
jgi:chaperone protein EcpD